LPEDTDTFASSIFAGSSIGTAVLWPFSNLDLVGCLYAVNANPDEEIDARSTVSLMFSTPAVTKAKNEK
jgi:hypothetical protein